MNHCDEAGLDGGAPAGCERVRHHALSPAYAVGSADVLIDDPSRPILLGPPPTGNLVDAFKLKHSTSPFLASPRLRSSH